MKKKRNLEKFLIWSPANKNLSIVQKYTFR